MFMLLAIAGALATNPSPKPGAAAPAPAGTSAVTTAKPTIYCIEGPMTGSRIFRRVCATRAQWLQRNFDPLRPED